MQTLQTKSFMQKSQELHFTCSNNLNGDFCWYGGKMYIPPKAELKTLDMNIRTRLAKNVLKYEV